MTHETQALSCYRKVEKVSSISFIIYQPSGATLPRLAEGLHQSQSRGVEDFVSAVRTLVDVFRNSP
jgi:hypothetical protein